MINEQIRDREVRVDWNRRTTVGHYVFKDAQKIADEAELDLIKISPQAKATGL